MRTEILTQNDTEVKNQSQFEIAYRFNFPGPAQRELKVCLDSASLQIIRPQRESYPDWTKLERFRCPHCPLSATEHEYCPLALSLVEVIEKFHDAPSYQSVEIQVESPARNYWKYSSLQSGVSSILGIYMVSSGCPYMTKLKPMLYFHLPFASLEETQIRSLSMYLLSQYIVWKKGGTPDWEMNNLMNHYEDIRILNHSVSKKIANLEMMDTSINSLIILNNFADYVTFTIDEKILEEIEFYLKEFTG